MQSDYQETWRNPEIMQSINAVIKTNIIPKLIPRKLCMLQAHSLDLRRSDHFNAILKRINYEAPHAVSTAFRHFLPFTHKYSPKHPVLKHLPVCYFRYVRIQY
jgi:hypothetical protein